jgi:hypothetical protein
VQMGVVSSIPTRSTRSLKVQPGDIDSLLKFKFFLSRRGAENPFSFAIYQLSSPNSAR